MRCLTSKDFVGERVAKKVIAMTERVVTAMTVNLAKPRETSDPRVDEPR